MIYVFPVSTSDSSLIDPLHAAIKHLGGMQGRKCVAIGDQSARDAVDYLADRLENLNAKVEKHIFPFTCEDGWPRACNRYFTVAAALMAKQDEPFYYFELDNTPIKAGWLDKIEGEYMAGLARGKPFMGYLVPHRVNRNGVWSDDGNVMNGSGVYPSLYGHVSLLIREVARQSVPWDVYMRWEMVNDCKDANDFLLFNWHSTNYRWKDCLDEATGATAPRLVCDIDKRPGGILHNGKSDPVESRHFIVHGCKDGSLSRMVVAGEIAAPPITSFEEVSIPATPAAGWDSIKDESLQGGQAWLSRESHKLVIEGSNPSPATNSIANGAQGDPATRGRKPRHETNRLIPASAKKKKKRKLNLSEAERARRSEHARKMTEARQNKIVRMAA